MADEFSTYLQHRMTELALQADELAARVGVSQSSIRRWLSGQRIPSKANCDRIALALGDEPAGVRSQAGRQGRQLDRLTHTQRLILLACVESSGVCYYNQLPRKVLGRRDLSTSERLTLFINVQSLVKRGLLDWQRKWGHLETGQVELVRLTDAGRHVLEQFERSM